MSFKSKVLAAAATLTLVGGLGAAGAATAGSAAAATPSCGGSCINYFSPEFGNHGDPNFTMDVYRRGENVNQPVIMFQTSNNDPALDWTISLQGTVAEFYAADLVSAALNLHYASDNAYEIQYSPYGVDSGLCAGIAETAITGEGVSLQPCGVSSKTVWVVDGADTTAAGNVPLINGSDTNFSQPFVLTYPSGAYPTDKPRPQLQVANLNGFSSGDINSNQLFGWFFGAL